MFVRFMFILDFVFILFRIAWWSSAGHELSSWPSALAVFISCRLSCVCVYSFAIGCLEQDVEFDCIVS